ncbi:MAG: hypothetical protein ACXWNG_03075 [Candidatus Limnocylindrales bacterium]
MPGLRALGSSLLAGAIVLAVVAFWMRWPIFLAVAMGALFLVATLMVASSFADDGIAADAAWQAASSDLSRGADPEAPRQTGGRTGEQTGGRTGEQTGGPARSAAATSVGTLVGTSDVAAAGAPADTSAVSAAVASTTTSGGPQGSR